VAFITAIISIIGDKKMISPEPSSHLYAVILAGGSGTRLWPLSRMLQPKQLLHLPGCQDGRSLLQETVARVLAVISPERLLVVTHHEQELEIRRHLELLDPERAGVITILAEPVGRNTTPAIAWAAQVLAARDPEAMMVVLPADQLIRQPRFFWEALETGIPLAQQDYLVTFGITPNRPESGYGYIKQGERLASGTGTMGVYQVDRFVEKPDAETAKRYLDDGSYFWNSGIFFWQAAGLLRAVERWQPQLYQNLEQMGFDEGGRPLLEDYSRLDNISIDYGVMEKHDRCALALLPSEVGWTDLGSWEAVHDVAQKDQDGNYLEGDILIKDCRDNFLLSSHRLVAALGLDNLVVVETPDAVLIAKRRDIQKVKEITQTLAAQGSEVYRTHRTVYRPWGTYTVLEEGPGYKIKRIEVYPKGRLSLQYHHRRSEHWVVISGRAQVTRGDEIVTLETNESTFIPLKTPHRLENPWTTPTVIIEVQNGDYLGEDDIVRLEDVYGRLRDFPPSST
jgi:mannose-1-phosphate guanylyltransferase/mannose-6-phosphate isomerase